MEDCLAAIDIHEAAAQLGITERLHGAVAGAKLLMVDAYTGVQHPILGKFDLEDALETAWTGYLNLVVDDCKPCTQVRGGPVRLKIAVPSFHHCTPSMTAASAWPCTRAVSGS